MVRAVTFRFEVHGSNPGGDCVLFFLVIENRSSIQVFFVQTFFDFFTILCKFAHSECLKSHAKGNDNQYEAC